MIIGTAAEVIDQLSERVEAGIERFMLQWMELDDMEKSAIAGAGCAAAILTTAITDVIQESSENVCRINAIAIIIDRL